MGYQNVARAEHWAYLQTSDRELTRAELDVLRSMCDRARDETKGTQEAGIYDGGWPYLAIVALRRRTYDANAKKAVQRAIAGLMKRGAIERVAPGRLGQNTVYRITLPPWLGTNSWWIEYADSSDQEHW